MSAVAIASADWIELCHGDEVAEGEAKGFAASGRAGPKIIVARKNGALVAYFDACPHHGGTPMAWRTNAYLSGDRQHLACHSHHALFDIETGDCVLGPCLGQSLTGVELRIGGDGTVHALV